MIQELRDQLISDLETGSDGAATPIGITVYGLYPEKVVPPCAVIGIPPGQYVTGGQTFGTYEVAATVVLMVKRSPTYVADLEALIEIVLENTADWALKGVDTPSVFTMNGSEWLGTVVSLSKQAKQSKQ